MKVYCVMLEHYYCDECGYPGYLELKKIFSSREAAVKWLTDEGCEVNEYYQNEYTKFGEAYEIVEREVE